VVTSPIHTQACKHKQKVEIPHFATLGAKELSQALGPLVLKLSQEDMQEAVQRLLSRMQAQEKQRQAGPPRRISPQAEGPVEEIKPVEEVWEEVMRLSSDHVEAIQSGMQEKVADLERCRVSMSDVYAQLSRLVQSPAGNEGRKCSGNDTRIKAKAVQQRIAGRKERACAQAKLNELEGLERQLQAAVEEMELREEQCLELCSAGEWFCSNNAWPCS
jgi:hypothetical protein